MLSLHKTVRKYFGEAIVVTQEVEDIISSPIVKESIINNADCKILLDQRKYRNKFDQIQTLLGLTDKERAQVLSINLSNDPARRYKEVFISLGGVQSAVYATEVSDEEYLAFTTEQTEKMEVYALAEKLDGDIEAAMAHSRYSDRCCMAGSWPNAAAGSGRRRTMRRYAFGIVGTALALVVLPCLLLLTVDMEERRIAPLAGRWASVLHPGATADIRRGPECYILTLRRPGEGFRHGRTFRLRYRRGIYYLDAGRRVELYAPTTNRLLLLPGGSYRRITNLKKHDS